MFRKLSDKRDKT